MIAVLKLKENTMGTFVEIKSDGPDPSYVNLDHVARVGSRQVKLWSGAKNKVSRAVLFAPDGSELGVAVYLDADQVGEQSLPLVPAAPGAEVVLLHVCSHEDNGRPTIDDVYVERQPL
jgi:hypothetical protein